MLHDYQQWLVSDVRDAFARGHRSVLMQLGTGGGKTHTAAEIIRLAVSRGSKVVFAAHLDSLLDDTSARLAAAQVPHGIIQADRPRTAASVQVASLATLHRRDERPDADLVIVDEAHRAASASIRGILEGYPRARILGLSATPERGDAQPLGDVFDAMVCGPSMAELTRRGFLVPALVLSPPAPIDGGIAMPIDEAVSRYCQERRTLVFARDLQDAATVASNIPGSLTVTGSTPRTERRAAYDAIASGRATVLVNVDVLREGADIPSIDAVVLGRTFGVCSAMLQAVGRGLRACASTQKKDCLIVDLSGAAIVHGLPADDRIWSLTGAAVQRTGDALIQLARCRACFAIFASGPAKCPRCGARPVKLPRRATRIERAELSRIDERPQSERDRIALLGIQKRLRQCGKYDEPQIARIAESIFRKSHRRNPDPERAA